MQFDLGYNAAGQSPCLTQGHVWLSLGKGGAPGGFTVQVPKYQCLLASDYDLFFPDKLCLSGWSMRKISCCDTHWFPGVIPASTQMQPLAIKSCQGSSQEMLRC